MMEFLNTLRIGAAIILAVIIGVNFFYQVFQAIRKFGAIQYCEGTVHQFRCQACESPYELNGQDLKSRTSIWTVRKEIKTPKSQTTSIRFECPLCREKAFQEKVFDTNATAALGNIRTQYDESSRAILLELLVKGFFPVILGMFILNLLF